MLNETPLDKAQEFIWLNARLLERQLFACLFDGGSRLAVIDALRAYQNPDGGFGNALEPDKRCPESQPIDMEMALHVLDMADAMDEPLAVGMVERACDWLLRNSTREGGLPFALPSVMNYPRAPWWQAEDNPPASINPTAAIAGLLLKHNVRHPWVARASEFCWRVIAESESDEYHDLMPMVEFLTHAIDRKRAERELQRIADRIVEKKLVAYDPNAEGYVKFPLDWAPAPESTLGRLFSDEVIALHLMALAQGQQADGGWTINWPPISPAVEMEWRGIRTIQALQTLKAYDYRARGQEVQLDANGASVKAYLARPERGNGLSRGVLVLHAWWGLTPFFKGLCDRLAAEGFVALAPDLYDGKTARTIDEAKVALNESDYKHSERSALAALRYLRQHPNVTGDKIGAVGFSMGAAWSINLSARAPDEIGAVVLFYGTGSADFANASARYVGHFAETDEWEPMEGVEQMVADMHSAGRDVTLYLYSDVGHWFFEADRPDHYDAHAAKLAWERTIEFLKASANDQ